MAAPVDKASAVFRLARVKIRWTVPRDTPILSPACSWNRPSKSHRRRTSNSSRYMVIFFSSGRGVPVGLNALQQALPSQRRFFLGRGDIFLFYSFATIPFLDNFRFPLVIPLVHYSMVNAKSGTTFQQSPSQFNRQILLTYRSSADCSKEEHKGNSDEKPRKKRIRNKPAIFSRAQPDNHYKTAS